LRISQPFFFVRSRIVADAVCVDVMV
jgi:hypothetical protein